MIKKRILFSLGNFPPSRFGGISNSMYNIISELNLDPNYEINVITTTYKLPKDANILKNQWQKYNNINVNYFHIISFPFSLNLILEGLKQIRLSDHIHLSSIFYFPNFIFIFISYFLGKSFIIMPHGELYKPALKIKYWKKAPYLFMLSLVLKNTKFVVTSQCEYERVSELFPKSQIQIIPNICKVGLPLRYKKKNQFLFLGRIHKIKNIDKIIIACGVSLFFKEHKCKFIIAGPFDNDEIHYLKELNRMILENDLTEYIEIVGEVNSPTKEKLISESKALLLVSDSENFGNVVVESLAQGTPVITSKGTPWQSLETFKSGFWIDNSSEMIAEKLDTIIMMENFEYNEMIENSIVHSQEFNVDKILKFWNQIIN
jgi:glycosyltransferase involved in cell wall biosynthesis